MKSEKLPFHPHGSLRAGYAKCYFAHLLYNLITVCSRSKATSNGIIETKSKEKKF